MPTETGYAMPCPQHHRCNAIKLVRVYSQVTPTNTVEYRLQPSSIPKVRCTPFHSKLIELGAPEAWELIIYHPWAYPPWFFAYSLRPPDDTHHNHHHAEEQELGCGHTAIDTPNV
jgi:hypothetical protein